ncbi:hypothetical protein Emag_007645 [Eimeria magna]
MKELGCAIALSYLVDLVCIGATVRQSKTCWLQNEVTIRNRSRSEEIKRLCGDAAANDVKNILDCRKKQEILTIDDTAFFLRAYSCAQCLSTLRQDNILAMQQQTNKELYDFAAGLKRRQEGNVLDDFAKLEVIVAGASERPALVQRDDPMRRKAFPKAALRFAVLITFAFMLGTLCNKGPSEARIERRTSRRLADSRKESISDEELDGILEACVDYDEEVGRLPNIIEQQNINSLEASTQKALLVALMEGIASSMQSPTDPLTSSSPQGQPSRSSSVAGAFLEPPIPHFQPFSAEKYVDVSTVSTATRTAPFEELQEDEILPALKPDAWLEYIPPIGDEENGETGTKAAHLRNQKIPDDLGQSSTLPDSMAQLAPTGAVEDIGWNVHLHPFVRLPKVPPAALEEGLKSQAFRGRPVRWNASIDMLRTLHDLFLKQELNAQDVELLAYTQDRLVRLTMLREPNQLLSTQLSSKLRQIGRSFLTIEAVVCACHLLGIDTVKVDWWASFSETIRTDYDLPEPAQSAELRAIENHRLAKRLVSALKLLKKGIRPPPRQLIALKRMLLCSKYSLSYFKESRWSPWRLDEDQFAKSQASLAYYASAFEDNCR